MRIVYFGTPEYAVAPLNALIKSKHEVVGVVCNNDKPVGRKHVITPPQVKVVAMENNIPVFQFYRISSEDYTVLKSLDADLFITCAFGQILSRQILDIPKLYTINLHGSLLPELRGAAPIQRAIMNGLNKTGVTVMKTEEGLDTGDILIQKSLKILPDDTSEDLFNKMSLLSAEIVIKALELIENDKAVFTPQYEKKATYAQKLLKEDGLINWNQDAETVYNRIRACIPEPISYTYYNGEQIKIYSAKLGKREGLAGKVISLEGGMIEVGCKIGSIVIKTLQKAGSNKMSSQDFLRGSKLKAGDILG